MMKYLIFILVGALCSCQKKSVELTQSINGLFVSSDAVATNVYYIAPKTTDANITTHLSNHYASVQSGAVLRNVLYVWLPGSYRNPTNSKATTQNAASIGFHSIGLMYPNTAMGNSTCRGTGDITCHSRFRREVIDGIDRHPSVSVNAANSVLNRLTKLLVYLHKTYPTQGWGQYLLNGKPNWSKIILSGHSQGEATAGVMGKYYAVKKVIMISMMDYLTNGKIPDWVANQTNKEKYYALLNTKDELVPYASFIAGWKAMGVSAYGNSIDVDYTSPPYGNTHSLITTIIPSTTMVDKFHNSTGVDSYIPKNATGTYIYDKAWEYLMKK